MPRLVRDEWIPTTRKQLKHKIDGRHVFQSTFRANKHYDLNDVKDFVRKTRRKLVANGNDRVIGMQINYLYANGKWAGTTHESIHIVPDLVDYRHAYNEDCGEIVSFTIQLT